MATFENIKVGDSIVFNTGGLSNRTLLSKIVKVTPKQFVCDAGYKFCKEDGRVIGGSRYNKCRLATEEDFRAVEEAKHRTFLSLQILSVTECYSCLDKVSTKDLEAIYDIVKKYINNK